MRTFKYNLLITFIFLLLLEIIGQIIFLFKHHHSLFSDPQQKYRELIFEKHPYLNVALRKNVKANFADQTEKTITTTSIGTRGTGADLSEKTKIRVACLGGSTTFCTMVTDEESWPAQLQKILGDKYAVINYGCPGYSSVENIIQLSLIVPETKPAIVIFYEGWNDIRSYHQQNSYPDYNWHGSNQTMNVLSKDENETCFQKIKKHSGLFYIIDNLRERIFKPKQPELFTTPDPVIDNLFVRNLETLQTLSKNIHAKSFFIPQIINPEIKRTKGTARTWTPAIDDVAFPGLMKRFNEIQERTIEGDSTSIFLKEALDIKWSASDFADDGHFSKKGNQRFAEMVAKRILN